MSRLLAVSLALLLAVAPAHGRSKHDHGAPKADAAGTFDYYVLSLSWSPTYCESHREDSAQCGARRSGFVLHGLWPQYQAGGFPQACPTQATLDEDARRLGTGVFPSEKLVAHEWTKHGTCSGLDAKTYFQRAGQARDAIRIPPRLQPGTRSVSLRADEIARLLRDANPAITRSGIAVVCAHQELSEVRICLGKDLQPRECGNAVRNACPAGPVRVGGVQ